MTDPYTRCASAFANAPLERYPTPRQTGDVIVPDSFVDRIRWIARIWGLAVLSIFLGLALEHGVPTNTYASNWATSLQIILLLIFALGMLLSWRWEATGALLMIVPAFGLGVLASLEYQPDVAFLLFMLFFIPSFLIWFCWQRTRTIMGIFVLALVTGLLLATGGITSANVYDYYFGPTHPVSQTQLPPVDLVEWVWAGATTSRSITINARIVHDSSEVSLLLSRSADFSEPIRVGPIIADQEGNDRIVSIGADGLDPDTLYYYAFEVDGKLDQGRRGQFRTFAEGPSSFTFAFGSCARNGSNGAVYDAIRSHDPLLFLNVGDLHYRDITVPDVDRYLSAYDKVLTAPARAALYQGTSFVYVWDDHDYGANNSDATSPSREAARLAYRQVVPHYPLPAGDGDAAIYQAFTVGRARFIVTDLRSERSPDSQPDGPAKTMMGAEQKAWFKEELLAAKGAYPVVFWISSVPWIAEAQAGLDDWGGYDHERREIADFIAQHDIEGLVVLSGDAHMLAIDDGTNSVYASEADSGFPVMQGSALDRRGFVRGGPYSEGAYPGGGQFGLVTVDDAGENQIRVTLSGRNWEDTEIVSYSFLIEVNRS